MKEEEINKKVDTLLEGKGKSHKPVFWKRKILGPISIQALVLFLAAVVTASTITYIVSVNISGTKQPVLEVRESLDDGVTWSDWENGEELDFNWELGDIVEYEGSRLYELQTTTEYDLAYPGEDIDVTFSVTNINDAMTVIDTSDDTSITDGMTKTVPQTGSFTFKVVIDIGLWTFSGYSYDDLEVQVTPII